MAMSSSINLHCLLIAVLDQNTGPTLFSTPVLSNTLSEPGRQTYVNDNECVLFISLSYKTLSSRCPEFIMEVVFVTKAAQKPRRSV